MNDSRIWPWSSSANWLQLRFVRSLNHSSYLSPLEVQSSYSLFQTTFITTRLSYVIQHQGYLEHCSESLPKSGCSGCIPCRLWELYTYGVTGNLIAFVTLRHRQFSRNATIHIMMVLCLLDTVFLFTPFLGYIIRFFLNKFVELGVAVSPNLQCLRADYKYAFSLPCIRDVTRQTVCHSVPIEGHEGINSENANISILVTVLIVLSRTLLLVEATYNMSGGGIFCAFLSVTLQEI